jgi:hypothetical protein
MKLSTRLALATTAALGLVAVPAAAAGATGGGRVTLCHNTHSATNPVVFITVSRSAFAAHVYAPGHNPAQGGSDGLYDGEGGCYYAD